MTDRYAVIGNPIVQSKSPSIHLAFAKETGQDLDYLKLEAPIDGFAGKVDEFRKSGGRGLNVTAPFKLDAYAYATDLRERAQLAGAVNAMKFEGDRVIADNFDGIGLTNDIRLNLATPLEGRRILLLGAGGAARGAILPFLEQKPARLTIANRALAKAQGLAERFSPFGAVSAVNYESLEREGEFDIVVNGTSASLRGELPPISGASFAAGCLAYEMVYGKGLTPFLKIAQKFGAKRLADGVGMLVEQAAEAFEWWRGVRPDTRPLIESLTVPLV